MQRFRQHVAIDLFVRSAKDLHYALIAIDVYNHFFIGNTLQFQSVKTGKFAIGAKVSAHITVHRNAG